MAEDTVSHKIREFGNWIRFEKKQRQDNVFSLSLNRC